MVKICNERNNANGPWKSSDETSKTVLLQDNIITSFAMKISLQEKKNNSLISV